MSGSPSPEQTERNKELVNDYLSGNFTLKELIAKYEITRQRVWQIVRRAKIRG